MDNCILYDWLTFSLPEFTLEQTFSFLGLPDNLSWSTGLGSRLFYGERCFFSGISIHSTSDLDSRKLNKGCCVEMSGQGCRAYETYAFPLSDLIDRVLASGFSVSRVDIAYDDFNNVIPLDQMAFQAQNFYFTSRLQARTIVNDSEFSDTGIYGLTVSHGSRCSRTYIRCYDKRVERHAFNMYDHWVRLEVQLRNENATNFLLSGGSLGARFSGLLRNYLCYREPNTDSNKRRWAISEWWNNFLLDVDALSVASKRDLDYNKDRFDDFVFDHMHNVIKTAVLLYGPVEFLRRVFGFSEDMPTKYKRLLSEYASADPAELQRFFDLIQGDLNET